MSIWNKVLLGLILVASIAFFILGARALQTHKYWRDQVAQLEKELADELKNQADMKDEVRQLTVGLHEQLIDRGRVWYGCRPQQVSAETGEVSVMTDFPDPHGIETQTVLWVFDEIDRQNGGSYLGQFTVDAIAGQGNRLLQLKPSMRMSQEHRQKLQQSAAGNGVTWALYEIMPVDNHDSLAGLDAEQLKALLPDSVEEYIMDGQLATLEAIKQQGLQGNVFKVDETGEVVKRTDPEDIQKRGLEVEVEAENEQGRYVRQLRDYEELFRQYDLQRTAWSDKWDSTTRENNYITQAHDDAKLQLQHRQSEKDRLKDDRTKDFEERDVAAAHLEAVSAKLAAIRAAIGEAIKTNQAMAGEIARIQREATRLIDEETRKMARADAGR